MPRLAGCQHQGRRWDTTSSADDWFDVEGEEGQWGHFIRRLLRQLEAAVADPRQSS
ncbi:hypothetical protein ACFYZJ_32390 [Streptomyces sp. NPDC001848]|uniref:hypothetical protein n=1 Tax=Streptomyces sp. NPDC001848 TaxID=3364618 RepID=UPI00367FB66D